MIFTYLSLCMFSSRGSCRKMTFLHLQGGFSPDKRCRTPTQAVPVLSGSDACQHQLCTTMYEPFQLPRLIIPPMHCSQQEFCRKPIEVQHSQSVSWSQPCQTGFLSSQHGGLNPTACASPTSSPPVQRTMELLLKNTSQLPAIAGSPLL